MQTLSAQISCSHIIEIIYHKDPDLLYNLGLCYVDLGQLDQGRELLHRCLQFAPRTV
ncbi:MAG: hypothetical protein NTY37_12300 [Methanothrix sp.]|nr:hypothetical protein [Methanothrix sp.]